MEPGRKARGRALVTGASSGIGEAFARRLAAEGYDLVLVARRRERLEALAASLGRERGVVAEVLAVDLAVAEGVERVAERLSRGDIGLLVNNAGFGTSGEFAALPVAREMEEIAVNVTALVRLTHAAVAAMAPQGRGVIINVASTAAFQPVPYMATYGATKAFVLSFSEAVHEEVRGRGVTVTCVCPGPVRTEFQEVAGVRADRLRAGWVSCERVVDAALRAASRRQALVVPGGLNRAMAVAARLSPRFLVRRVTGAMFKRVAAEKG